MPARLDLVGRQFGRLTVLEFAGMKGSPRSHWRCRCVCGNEKIASGPLLMKGETSSCGCARVEQAARTARTVLRTHGHRKPHPSLTYVSWQGMRQRCSNPSVDSYQYYGGRGIRVCDHWLVFENFLADMGERPSKEFSIDRVDPNGNYEPGNCRWATIVEQRQNRRETA